MKLKYTMMITLIVTILFTGCNQNSTGPEGADYSASFEKVWNDVDSNYSYFIHKQIDWDDVKIRYEPLARSPATYDFFINDILKCMLGELHDLHVSIQDKDGHYIAPYTRDVFANYRFDSAFYSTYISGPVFTSDEYIACGSIHQTIGYVLIASWTSSSSGDVDEFLAMFDNEETRYENMTGLIIDVRPNGGGSDALAKKVASRFADGTKTYEYVKYRNGPGHDDFTALQALSFSPAGPWQYTGPVALLIGEKCMSSNESFILMMSTLDHVTTIGDTTGGSSGNPGEFSLEDGTTYRISRWISYKPDMTILEDTGIYPDIPVAETASLVNGRDMVLEKAIEILQQ